MNITTISTQDVGGGAEKIASELHRSYQLLGHQSSFIVGRKQNPHSAALGMTTDRNYRAKNPVAIPWRPDSEVIEDIKLGKEIHDFPVV